MAHYRYRYIVVLLLLIIPSAQASLDDIIGANKRVVQGAEVTADEFIAIMELETARRAAILNTFASRKWEPSASNRQIESRGEEVPYFQPNGTPQVVYIDFNKDAMLLIPILNTSLDVIQNAPIDAFTLDFLEYPGYNYSKVEQELILGIVQDKFQAFDYVVVGEKPDEGPYTTIALNNHNRDQSDGAVGFVLVGNATNAPAFFKAEHGALGQASTVDFRNGSRNDTAIVDANVYVWRAYNDLDQFTEDVGALANKTFATHEELVSHAIVAFSALVAAHELGHLVGLRHHDCFGPIGGGIGETVNTTDFIPAYDGKMEASESTNHLMGSPNSVGFSADLAFTTNQYLSERSALKVALSRGGPTWSELTAARRANGALPRFKFPNTILRGQNAGRGPMLEAGVVVIEGKLETEREIDEYRFYLEQDTIVNAEVISLHSRRSNWVISRMTILRQENNGTLTEVTNNRESLQSFDPIIFDYVAPSSGIYVFRVQPEDESILDVPVGFYPISYFSGFYDLLIFTMDPPSPPTVSPSEPPALSPTLLPTGAPSSGSISTSASPTKGPEDTSAASYSQLSYAVMFLIMTFASCYCV